MERCVILNGDYTYLNIVDWRKALCLLYKGKTEVLKYSETIIRNCEGVITRLPIVMRLIKIFRLIYRNKVPFTKKNIFVRDGYKCMYCGTSGSVKLTIDHIIPLSRNGKTNFENCVSACRPCNNKKGRRTPSEAKMYLLRQPHAPTISEFIALRMNKLGITEMLKELGVF